MTVSQKIQGLLSKFAGDESGSPAIEYSLMGALIGIACVAVFVSFGDSLSNLFGSGSGGASPVLEAAATTASGS